jgi:L-histidine N-alpha-methyltransferase
VKDIEVLNDAYNDAQGYTAEFNLNLLERINSTLGGQFNLNSFAHKAFFNAKESRIEMHLVSLIEQSVRVRELDEEFNFAKGETIHTENSYKFTTKMIEEIAGAAGLKILDKWCDSKEYFSLCLFGK